MGEATVGIHIGYYLECFECGAKSEVVATQRELSDKPLEHTWPCQAASAAAEPEGCDD